MRWNRVARSFFLGFLIMALWGCSVQEPGSTPLKVPVLKQTRTPIAVPLPPPYAIPRTLAHITGPNETLWRISKSYNVNINTLMKVNHINDPKLILNGQKIVIPNTLGPVPIIPLYPDPAHRWTHIVIHHTDTDEGNAFKIDVIHHKRGFWNGLGYDFLIDNGTDGTVDGQIEVGPRWIKQMVGAHCNVDGMNEHGIGIALVGNYSVDHVSEASLNSLVYLAKVLSNYYRIPVSNIVGHGAVPGKNTECPGKHFPFQEFKHQLAQS